MLQSNINTTIEFFYDILSRNISDTSISWLNKNLAAIKEGEDDKTFYTSFSMAPRITGKDKLILNKEDLDYAHNIKEGLNFENFSIDQITRILLLLSTYKNNNISFNHKLEKILSTADIQEQIVVYSALSLLPHPETFAEKAANGIRTNITAVFDSIVLENPYPFEYLSEDAWNQMVLKAVFTNRPLYKIYGFDKRRNATLAKMISDFAHERWAAGRNVTPELWRAVPPFLEAIIIKDIEKLLLSNNPLEVEAACLVLSENSSHTAIPSKHTVIINRIAERKLTWNTLGEKVEQL